MADSGGVTRLGNIEEGRVQKFFCINDPDQPGMSGTSGEVRIVKKTPRTIYVNGKEVKGWIVEMLTPSTDGIVRIDPNEDIGIGAADRH